MIDTGTRRPLPTVLLLTDRTQVPEHRDLIGQVVAAVEGGIRAVVVREKDRSRAERRRWAVAIGEVLHPVGGRLLVASDVGLAIEIGADGAHLAATDPWPEPAPALPMIGRSAHDPGELDRAEADGATYATLSPVFATDSKPGYGPAVGEQGLADATRRGIDIYALGGVTPRNAGLCARAGATGVAVMGAVMRSLDPAATAAALIEAFDRAKPAPGDPPLIGVPS